MKLKLLILKVILILSFFSNNSFAKNLLIQQRKVIPALQVVELIEDQVIADLIIQ